jgi:hypothetical protein
VKAIQGAAHFGLVSPRLKAAPGPVLQRAGIQEYEELCLGQFFPDIRPEILSLSDFLTQEKFCKWQSLGKSVAYFLGQFAVDRLVTEKGFDYRHVASMKIGKGEQQSLSNL